MSDEMHSTGKRLAQEMAATALQLDPDSSRWLAEVTRVIAHVSALLEKAPPKIDPRSVNLARTHLETSALWVGNAANILLTGVGAGFRKPGN